MKVRKYQPQQISFKLYMSEYKSCKLIQRNQQFEMSYVRNITTRKKYLSFRKNSCSQSEVNTIISEVKIYKLVNEIPSINKFVGYVLQDSTDSHKGNFFSCVYLLYQFSEVSLDSYIQTPSQSSREDSLCLLRLVYQRLIETTKMLSKKNLKMNQLCLDFRLVALQLNVETINKVALTYVPFDLYQLCRHQSSFATRIYSLKGLQNLDSSEKNSQIQSLFEAKKKDRSTNILKRQMESQMLQKIGLFLIKLVLLCCQQVHMREVEVNLYAINKDFKLDYNWELINPLLAQCYKQKDYKQLAKIIQALIFNSQEESLQQYQRKIKGFSQQENSQKIIIRPHSNTKSKKQCKQAEQYLLKSDKKCNSMIKQAAIVKKESFESKIRQLPGVVEIRHQNGRYIGQIADNKRQGLGIYYFQEEQIYAGEWKNDQMIGNGVYLFLKQDQYYEGTVQCGTKSGVGCYYYRDGNIYNGNWSHDIKEGYGELYNARENEYYKGNFHNNMQHGLGIIEYSNGHKFEGNFQNGLKHGIGRIYNHKNEVTLKAKWERNQISGEAEIFFEGGDYYVGSIKRGMMDGEGQYRYKCGTIYSGEFIQNQMSGKCKITYSNGDQYQGQVIRGKFSSQGVYHYKNENIVEISHWINGQQIGNVEFIHQDRSVTASITQRRIQTIIMENQA